MNRNIFLAGMVFTLAASRAGAAPPAVSMSEASANRDPLFGTISALDAAFFGAFNHCSSPDQLKKHASYLDPRVEFYHDKGVLHGRGKTISRKRARTCAVISGAYLEREAWKFFLSMAMALSKRVITRSVRLNPASVLVRANFSSSGTMLPRVGR